MQTRGILAITALMGALAMPAAAVTAVPSIQADLRYTYWGIGDRVDVNESSDQILNGAPASASLQHVFTQTITSNSDGSLPNTYLNTADIALSASGSFSRLHARAAATLTSQENALYVGDGGSNGGLLMSGANVRFKDQITITGPLAAGTPIQLTAWVYLEATLSATQSGYCDFEWYSPASAGISLRFGSFSVGASRSSCENRPLASQSFEAVVGDTFEIEGSLGANNYINSSSDIPEIQSVQALADASHTGYIFFTSSIDGVGVQALSGADYSQPAITMVPEPGEWAMLLAGLVMVGGVVRQHRRREVAQALPGPSRLTRQYSPPATHSSQ